MSISVVSIGKNKDSYIKEASEEYRKRISPSVELDLVYLPDIALTKTNNQEVVIEKEGKYLDDFIEERLRKGPKPLFLIALDSRGKQFKSEEFAKVIEDKSPFFDIVCFIGGVYGLSPNIIRKANLVLSLSKMTFTHQMTRIILLEQIYRAFSIIKGKKYHY
jgi:23S rRNA (pseudouridine1915-N3)-methyltransferase